MLTLSPLAPSAGQRVIGRYCGTPFAGTVAYTRAHTINPTARWYSIELDADLDVTGIRYVTQAEGLWLGVGWGTDHADDATSLFTDGLMDPQGCDHCGADVELAQRVLYKEHDVRGWVLCARCHAKP